MVVINNSKSQILIASVIASKYLNLNKIIIYLIIIYFAINNPPTDSL